MAEEYQIKGYAEQHDNNNTTATATSTTTIHMLKAIACSSTLPTAPSICIAVAVSIGPVDANPELHDETLAQLTIETIE